VGANPIPISPRRIYVQTEIYPASSILDVLLLIAAEKRTGSLVINFAGGKPDGTVEWKQTSKQKGEPKGESDGL